MTLIDTDIFTGLIEVDAPGIACLPKAERIAVKAELAELIFDDRPRPALEGITPSDIMVRTTRINRRDHVRVSVRKRHLAEWEPKAFIFEAHIKWADAVAATKLTTND